MRERAWVVGVGTVLALGFTKPPIGSQLSEYSVSPLFHSTFARGGTRSELEDPTFASRAVKKWPSSWIRDHPGSG
jgi:hypothetical protein